MLKVREIIILFNKNIFLIYWTFQDNFSIIRKRSQLKNIQLLCIGKQSKADIWLGFYLPMYFLERSNIVYESNHTKGVPRYEKVRRPSRSLGIALST